MYTAADSLSGGAASLSTKNREMLEPRATKPDPGEKAAGGCRCVESCSLKKTKLVKSVACKRLAPGCLLCLFSFAVLLLLFPSVERRVQGTIRASGLVGQVAGGAGQPQAGHHRCFVLYPHALEDLECQLAVLVLEAQIVPRT